MLLSLNCTAVSSQQTLPADGTFGNAENLVPGEVLRGGTLRHREMVSFTCDTCGDVMTKVEARAAVRPSRAHVFCAQGKIKSHAMRVSSPSVVPGSC